MECELSSYTTSCYTRTKSDICTHGIEEYGWTHLTHCTHCTAEDENDDSGVLQAHKSQTPDKNEPMVSIHCQFFYTKDQEYGQDFLDVQYT